MGVRTTTTKADNYFFFFFFLLFHYNRNNTLRQLLPRPTFQPTFSKRTRLARVPLAAEFTGSRSTRGKDWTSLALEPEQKPNRTDQKEAGLTE